MADPGRLWLPESWWQLAETVERLRAARLTSSQIAAVTGATAHQVDGLGALAGQIRADLERAVRG